ncbi:MAG: multidrug efflux SMR transporter [Actinomycetota bacterium]|nr:multidrug efflux SMR transporter [Actinomycetota bacterium]
MFVAAVLLGLAIVVEVAATAALPRTGGFSNPGWTAAVLAGYGLSIWLLAKVVDTLPVSVTYAIWSGAGTALVAALGVLVLGEHLDAVKVAGLAAIVVGVVLINLQSAH